MGNKNWFEILGASKNRGFEKSGIKLHCLTEANPRETSHGSKNRGLKNRNSTVVPSGQGLSGECLQQQDNFCVSSHKFSLTIRAEGTHLYNK